MNARIAEVFLRLEGWHLILRSDQRGVGMEASHDYLPKRYFFDTGILRALRESAVPAIRVLETVDPVVRKSLGGVLENQAAVDLAGGGLPLAGWIKTPSGGEIDFVVKSGDATIPVECKAALKCDRRHWQGVVEYLEQFQQGVGGGGESGSARGNAVGEREEDCEFASVFFGGVWRDGQRGGNSEQALECLVMRGSDERWRVSGMVPRSAPGAGGPCEILGIFRRRQ
jgi:hypothetical protein